MRDRVDIEVSADGARTVVRIGASGYRRIVDATKAVALTFVVLFGLSLLRPDRWSSPADHLALLAALSLLIGLISLLRSGETVFVTQGEVRILKSLDSFLVSRDEQSVPSYSPVPARRWFAQRWDKESGSGVLLFGTREKGVRFGVDLDEAQANRVLAAFSTPIAPQSPAFVSAGRTRFFVRALVHVAFPLCTLAVLWVSLVFDLPSMVVFALVGLVLIGLAYVVDLMERLFPRRITLE